MEYHYETYTFKEVDPNIVKVGVNAPKTVKVNREEVYHAKKKLERLDSEDRVVAKVKWFDSGKGMGFATAVNVDKDILIHYKQFIDRKDTFDIWEGDKVSLKIRKTQGSR